jgi:RNA polymerase sigma-70 factor (ECF subfamily)
MATATTSSEAEPAARKPACDLAALVERHQAAVWRYLRFLGCDPAQADDFTQETFLAVHRKPFEDRSPSATAAYLRTVARNLFLMSLRRAQRQTLVRSLEVADDVWNRLARDDSREHLAALAECVERLEGRARQAVELFYRQEKSRGDIGRELELGEEGVKTLLRRTREVLRRCVEQRLAE